MNNKHLIILYILIVSSLSAFSQTGNVGINTETPQGIFHIDSKGNTNQTFYTEDDIIINKEGNIGIGGAPTSAKLFLKEGLNIQDGTQADGKILVCDANGNAHWDYKTLGQIIEANEISNSILPSYPVTTVSKHMGISITLPPGKWQVNFNAVYFNSLSYSINIIWDICQSSTLNDNSTRSGRVYSYCALRNTYSPVTGIYFVEPTQTTTYYIWAAGANFPNNGSINYASGGALWAILVSDE